MDLNVIRPNIAGLMGAYGAALYAQRRYKDAPHQTTLLNLQQLGEFVHTVKGITCGLCNNHCHLTVNTFAGGKRFISGNRCERPITHTAPKDELNLYRQKLQLLNELPVNETPKRGIMGIPMGLNMLKDISADVLKIDMGFLRESENEGKGQDILESIITLASKIGMDVITEGVETKKQLDMLTMMGCHEFQGYYFSKPVPVSEFEEKYLV